MNILTPHLFLCHSQQDADFVEDLALRLTNERVNVWFDRWELRVGDSLLNRIQEAIDQAAYLGVVLSPASVESDWVRRELTAAMTRELEERRVVVLPILYQDCEIPLFLRDKLWADFRADFETGYGALKAALKPVELPTSSSINQGPYHHDYALSWSIAEDEANFSMDISSHDQESPVTVVARVNGQPNQQARARLAQIEAAGFAWALPGILLSHVVALKDHDLRVLIEDDQWKEDTAQIQDQKTGVGTTVSFSLRRLGSLPDKDLVYDLGEVVGGIIQNYVREERDAIPKLEREKLVDWLRENPP